MTDSLNYFWPLLIGYAIGSISFAVLVSRFYGVNIMQEGSCNAGATNVRRVIGKLPARIVFLLDFAKGYTATALPFWLDWPEAQSAALFAFSGAVLGHCFSVFLRFRGGKAVATSMGALMALMPLVTLACMVVWYIVFRITRYVSVASMAFAATLPIGAYVAYAPNSYIGFCAVLGVLIIALHHKNIRRLIDGTEGRYDPNAS